MVPTRDDEKAGVPGVYLAGDASGRVAFAVVAAAEGAKAAFAIDAERLGEDMRRPVTTAHDIRMHRLGCSAGSSARLGMLLSPDA